MPVIYATDLIIYLLVAFTIYISVKVRRGGYARSAWLEVRRRRIALISLFILSLYLGVAVMDSVRWRSAVSDGGGGEALTPSGEVVYEGGGLSILDRVLTSLRENTEKTYSSPLSDLQFTKENMEGEGGATVRGYPKLKHPGGHLLGTDKVGGDVLYSALKGVRTGIVIGTGATLVMIPFAILFGVFAGYFGGIVDDIIQYIYTTLSSIPDILLIIAFMLIFGLEGYQGGLITDKNLTLGVFVINERLFWLCLIMGVTSWTGLCRLIRGETLKLRELEYVQASRAFGLSHIAIIFRHIVPNIMHLVLITFVLQFSGLVLAEAVLSYIGIGVGAEMGSWGNMINTARLELSMEPAVWWNLFGAFVFMFGLVLPANILGDAVRDALDPRLRTR